MFVLDGDAVGEAVDGLLEVVTDQHRTVEIDRLDARKQATQSGGKLQIPSDIGQQAHDRPILPVRLFHR